MIFQSCYRNYMSVVLVSGSCIDFLPPFSLFCFWRILQLIFKGYAPLDQLGKIHRNVAGKASIADHPPGDSHHPFSPPYQDSGQYRLIPGSRVALWERPSDPAWRVALWVRPSGPT